MVDVQTKAKAFKVGSVQRRTLLQLLFCHCLIFTVAIISRSQTLAILFACLLSLLLLLNIPYNLHLLEIALDRLARGLPIEPISLRLRWPFTQLFVLVNTLTGQQLQMEQRNVAYRDQLLQQVGKTAAQEERNRLARDLHDSIKQQIFSIVVSAAAIKARWEHDLIGARKIIDDIERTAQEAQVEMQALLQQLRPTALENVGLIESLRMQCQALSYRTGAEVTTELGDFPPDELLPLGAQEMIFRIVQEGFANIARHARASHVWLSLQRQRDALLVEIGDDGQGFDLAQVLHYPFDSSGQVLRFAQDDIVRDDIVPAASLDKSRAYNESPNSYGGMGLSNVRERVSTMGGTVAVWSMPGKGTTLHLCIPLVKPQPRESRQTQIGEELAPTLRRMRRTLRIGIWMAQLAAALMVLGAQILRCAQDDIAQFAVIICIIVAFAAWLWTQQYRLQIALDLGRNHAQNLALQADSYGLLSATLLLSLLSLSYFDALRIAMYSPSNMPVTLSILAVFTGIIITIYVLHLRYTGHYYQALSPSLLREKIGQQLQQVVIDWMAWAIVVGLTFVQWLFVQSWQEDSVASNIALVMLGVWFALIVVKSLRAVRWQRILARMGA